MNTSNLTKIIIFILGCYILIKGKILLGVGLIGLTLWLGKKKFFSSYKCNRKNLWDKVVRDARENDCPLPTNHRLKSRILELYSKAEFEIKNTEPMAEPIQNLLNVMWKDLRKNLDYSHWQSILKYVEQNWPTHGNNFHSEDLGTSLKSEIEKARQTHRMWLQSKKEAWDS